MKKAMVWILAAVMGLTILGGCGKEKETPAPEPEKTQEEAAADPHQGQARSYFTGEWIDEDLAKVRPFAVMLGNTTQALPQYRDQRRGCDHRSSGGRSAYQTYGRLSEL